MSALGYHVWMIRFCAFMFSGLLTSIAGILFVYYTEFISPQALALTASAEGLLMVISGGAGTLLGPIVGAALVVIVKNVVSAYIERWNFMLGAIFVAIVVLMPEGLVPGAVRLVRSAWRAASRRKAPAARPSRSRSDERARGHRSVQVVRRPARHHQRQSRGRAGRAPADHRPERRRQDHVVQSHYRRDCAGQRLGRCCSAATSPVCRPANALISAWRVPIRSSRCLPATRSCTM